MKKIFTFVFLLMFCLTGCSYNAEEDAKAICSQFIDPFYGVNHVIEEDEMKHILGVPFDYWEKENVLFDTGKVKLIAAHYEDEFDYNVSPSMYYITEMTFTIEASEEYEKERLELIEEIKNILQQEKYANFSEYYEIDYDNIEDASWLGGGIVIKLNDEKRKLLKSEIAEREVEEPVKTDEQTVEIPESQDIQAEDWISEFDYQKYNDIMAELNENYLVSEDQVLQSLSEKYGQSVQELKDFLDEHMEAAIKRDLKERGIID